MALPWAQYYTQQNNVNEANRANAFLNSIRLQQAEQARADQAAQFNIAGRVNARHYAQDVADRQAALNESARRFNIESYFQDTPAQAEQRQRRLFGLELAADRDTQAREFGRAIEWDRLQKDEAIANEGNAFAGSFVRAKKQLEAAKSYASGLRQAVLDANAKLATQTALKPKEQDKALIVQLTQQLNDAKERMTDADKQENAANSAFERVLEDIAKGGYSIGDRTLTHRATTRQFPLALPQLQPTRTTGGRPFTDANGNWLYFGTAADPKTDRNEANWQKLP